MNEEDIKKVVILYGLFAVSATLNFVPVVWVSNLSLLIVVGTLIASFAFRRTYGHGSDVYQHMVYIWRTFWIQLTIFTLLSIPAGYIVFTQADNSPFDRFRDVLLDGGEMVEVAIGTAISDYIRLNFNVIMIAGCISVVPACLYLIYRSVNGIKKARAGQPPRNYLSWF